MFVSHRGIFLADLDLDEAWIIKLFLAIFQKLPVVFVLQIWQAKDAL